MKRTLVPMILVVAALGLFAADAGAAPTASAGDLYLAQATGGKLSGSKLVLDGLAPNVTVFADRPRRSASSLAATRFIAGWRRTFGDDPPNAALEVEGAPKSRDVAVLELRNPRLDREHGAVVFSVRRLKQSGDDALRSYDARADGNAVRSFGDASLFIDGGTPPSRLVLIRVTVGAGQTVGLRFGVPLAPLETFISGIRTPPAGTLQTVSNGMITARGGQFTFAASSGGGGLNAETVVQAEVAEGAPLTGTATIPAGSSIEMSIEGGEPQTLAEGPFSIGG